MNKTRNICLVVFLCLSISSFSQQNAPSGLLCELLSHPELSVITNRTPDFGWVVNAGLPGDYQTAYQLLVASSPDLLSPENADYWDSGKILKSQSINVEYAGKPLAPHQSYWWKVRSWGKTGICSSWSAPQRFNTSGFDEPKKWPGESKWVKLTDENGKQFWTVENRHPISFHDIEPIKVITQKSGVLFYDFNKSAFSYLTFNITWTPDKKKKSALKIAVGEKAVGDSIDRKPGGGIIYQTFDIPLTEGTHDYELKIPRFVPEYPNSESLPLDLPEVLPFRYCEITSPLKNIKVNKVVQKALYYLVDWNASSFSCSNNKLNSVYDLCKYSAIANTFNGDYANSQRERMMYEADCYIQQMSHYTVDREFAIARYSTENLIYHATWPTEWICHSVFMAWADYLNTGNTKLISDYYDDLKCKTLMALETDNGLISSRTGLQTSEFLKSIHYAGDKIEDIVDWPSGWQGIQPHGERDNHELVTYNTVVNAFYYRSLVLMGKMAEAIHKQTDAEFFDQKAQKVKEIFNVKFFDSKKGIYIDGIGTDHSSIHSNMFPLAFGLVPQENVQRVSWYIKSKGMACSVYGANYLLEALYNANEGQYALDLMTSETDRSWINMIRVGATITTEGWDLKYIPDFMSWSHAWSSSPAHIIPRKLMGIEPEEPGFGKIRIKPQPGNLTEASMKLPTIRGEILTSFKQDLGKSFELNITIPANTTAKVYMPQISEKYTLTIDGQNIIDSKNESSFIIDKIASGNHILKIQKVE